MATGMPPATRVLVPAENRSISAATTLAPKFEATALKSSVAKTESAIRVGLPNHSSNHPDRCRANDKVNRLLHSQSEGR
jgi:hypothetical protein